MRVPEALARRWKLDAEEKHVDPGVRWADSTGGKVIVKPQHPKIYDRWTELYTLHVRDAGPLTRIRKADEPTVKEEILGYVFHPHSFWRVTWDLVGLATIIGDILLIPFCVAWDQPTPIPVLIFGLTFWSINVLVTCNTGFYKHGVLQLSRWKILSEYARSWLLFDIVMLTIDFIMIFGPDNGVVILLRNIRFLRMLRLLRLVKINKLSQTMEDVCGAHGQQRVILAVAAVKILCGICLTAHLLACTWYYIGRTSGEAGMYTWIDETSLAKLEITDQYMSSLHWVLGQLTPAPMSIQPQNGKERLFNVMVALFSLFLMGTSISQMTAAINNLRALSNEDSKTKKALQRYLLAKEVPVELSVRIMRYVEHYLRRKVTTKSDLPALKLLSNTLLAELNMFQHSQDLVIYPLYALICEGQPEVFCKICGAFVTRTYGAGDTVFQGGSLAQYMYITVSGRYCLQKEAFKAQMAQQPMPLRRGASRHSAASPLQRAASRLKPLSVSVQSSIRTMDGESAEKAPFSTFESPMCFAEVSLFSQVVHSSDLQATSFADAFTISSESLFECVRDSPNCVIMIFEYGQSLLANLWVDPDDEGVDGKSSVGDVLPSSLAVEAAESTQYYKQLNTKPEEECEQAAIITEDPSWHDDATAPSELREQFQAKLKEFLLRAAQGDLSDDDIACQIPGMFPELDASHGTYARLSHQNDRTRCLVAMVSVLQLVCDRYEAFVKTQDPASCMTRAQWTELQGFVRWADVDVDTVHTVLAFIAIGGLGKVAQLVRMCPPECSQPQRAVLFMMRYMSAYMPSAQFLSEERREGVMHVLKTHAKFNFGQFIQGENIPSNVMLLQAVLKKDGCESVLKVYLLALMGMMSGLFGNRKNTRAMISALQCLQHLNHRDPHTIYWSYVLSRAEQWQLPGRSVQQLAFARLLTLARVFEHGDLVHLQQCWGALGSSDRQILTESLIADGICEKACLIAYLPQYLANARANTGIGLGCALEVLVELYELMRYKRLAEQTTGMTLQVDIKDLADFVAEVRSEHLFRTCLPWVSFLQCGMDGWKVRMKSIAQASSFAALSQAGEPHAGVLHMLWHITRSQETAAQQDAAQQDTAQQEGGGPEDRWCSHSEWEEEGRVKVAM